MVWRRFVRTGFVGLPKGQVVGVAAVGAVTKAYKTVRNGLRRGPRSLGPRSLARTDAFWTLAEPINAHMGVLRT